MNCPGETKGFEGWERGEANAFVLDEEVFEM